MRSWLCLVLVGAAFLSFAAMSRAQAPSVLGESLGRIAPASPLEAISPEKLQSMLADLGYQTSAIDIKGNKALKITLGHGDAARDTIVAIDKPQHVLVILSGGFNWKPQPALGDYSFYRKLLRINGEIAPGYIFLNEGDVFGLATVAGDSHLTADSLKKLLAIHQERFEQKLIPLVQELYPAPAPQ